MTRIESDYARRVKDRPNQLERLQRGLELNRWFRFEDLAKAAVGRRKRSGQNYRRYILDRKAARYFTVLMAKNPVLACRLRRRLA